jgi:Mor family transcriptional regulator
MTNKKNSRGVRIKDFKQGSLLHQVAKVDIVLALKLAKQFGGSKVYIGKFDTIKRNARNRSILKRASTCEGYNRIANDLGLTGNWVRRIIMADIKAYFARPLREIPE